MATVNKNGKAYDSGDVEVTVNGVPLEVTQISYNTEQEHQLNYTLKNKATSWSQGKITPGASMTVMMHDIAALESASDGDLLKIKPFDINVSYVNDYNDIVNDTLTVKFQGQGREVTGDMGLQYQYPLFALDIKFRNN